MRPKVFVTREFPQEALDLVAAECDTEVSPHKRVIKKVELLEKVKGKDGILVQVTDPINKEVIEAGNKLKIIASWGEGYNHIDLEVATERGIWVTNTPTSDIAVPVAEATIGLLLAVTKRIVEGDRAIRAGKFKGWEPLGWWGADLEGKTFGIVGLGRIGTEVAQRLQGWETEVLYYDIRRLAEKKWWQRLLQRLLWWEKEKRRLKVKYASLETLLRESDFISVHVPLNDKTYHLVKEEEFGSMKPTAYLINTARGAIIDEKALVKALKEKKIAGAALDVYEFEPDVSQELLELDNVVLTPHLAGATWRARVLPAVMAAKNLLAGVKGEVPPNAVNKVNVKPR